MNDKELKEEKHKTLLIEKLKEKYGTSKDTVIVINNLVSEYVKITPHINKESLTRLDMSIKRIVKREDSKNKDHQSKKYKKVRFLNKKKEGKVLATANHPEYKEESIYKLAKDYENKAGRLVHKVS